MKRKEEQKAKQGRLKIRVVLTAAGLLGAACNSPSSSAVAPSAMNSPCAGECGVTPPDGGHDGGVDAGSDAGVDGGLDGGDGG
jgi:hypothetical protein